MKTKVVQVVKNGKEQKTTENYGKLRKNTVTPKVKPMNPSKLDESPRSVAAPRQKIVASALWADGFPRLQEPRHSFNAGGSALRFSDAPTPTSDFRFLTLGRWSFSGCWSLAFGAYSDVWMFFRPPSSVHRPPVRGGGTFCKPLINNCLKQNQAKKRENREKYAKKVNRS